MNTKYECVIQYITNTTIKVTKEIFFQEPNPCKPWTQTQPQLRKKQTEKNKQAEKTKHQEKNRKG
jgi:hypothetical protein